MDVNAKVKELEDELKVLKTEIRSVLLDVREVILDRTNPLSEQQEPAYLRVDLKTTAQAIAAEEAARSAGDAAEDAARAAARAAEDAARAAAQAAEQARSEEHKENEPEEPEDGGTTSSPPEAEAEEEEARDEQQTEDKPAVPENGDTGSPPPKGKGPLDASLELTEIPPLYRAYPLPTGGACGLAAWVTEAMAAIGPQQLERVITIHRLWGCLPPNISQALAHLQELIRSSQEREPAWLKIMQDMERLSSS
jgi:chemotaxis protein histidine kinase CheA